MIRRRRVEDREVDERRDKPLRVFRERSRAGAPAIPSDLCEHLDAMPARDVGTPTTCEDHQPDDGPVVHLRACLTCGHVACCDSSQPQHATAHARATSHPVIQSAELGETWRWCYVDEVVG